MLAYGLGLLGAGATDAARAAADIVLCDPGLSVIIDAVSQRGSSDSLRGTAMLMVSYICGGGR